MNYKKYFKILKERFNIIFFTVLICVLASLFYTYYILKPEYQSNISVIINTNDSSTSKLTYDQFTLSKNLTETYGLFAKSKLVASDIIDELKLNYSESKIKSMISYSTDPSTQILNLTVTASSPKEAALIATQLAKSLRKTASNITKIDMINILDTASVPNSSSNVKPVLYIAIAIMLGLIISLTIIFIIEYMDNTLKNECELTSIIGSPVIGVIS